MTAGAGLTVGSRSSIAGAGAALMAFRSIGGMLDSRTAWARRGRPSLDLRSLGQPDVRRAVGEPLSPFAR